MKTFDVFLLSFLSPFLSAHCLPPRYFFISLSYFFVLIFCSVHFFSLGPLPPFPFYFLSPCNFLFLNRNWERQGCVGGHGIPPRKVWGFGQNRSFISSKHRSNLNCLQALVSNPASVVSVGLHEKGPEGCSVISLVLEKISSACASMSRRLGHPHSLSSSHRSPRETLLSEMPGWREAGLH